MKFLQIYDHLGNLVREFEVYVDGQDFNWAAPKPEPVWLGTIRLASEKATVPAEPTPEEEAPEVEPAPEEVEEARKQANLTEAQKLAEEAVKEAEVETQAPFTTPSITIDKKPGKKVKREPEKSSGKGRRSSRTSSSARTKRT